MKKVLILVMAILAAGAMVGCGKSVESKEETLKVALAIPGSKTDGGWSQTAYEGLLQIEDKLGAEITFHENTQVSDNERVLRDYAKAGNDIVIGHGFQFGDAALAVAKEFPKTQFIVTSTNVTNNTNLSSVTNDYIQAGFLQGAFAALMSKSGTVGAIAGLNIPSVTGAVDGFELGAKYINPKIKVVSACIETGDDVNKAKEQALTFIAQGSDIIMANANAAANGVYLAAEEKGIYSLASIAAQYDKFEKSMIGLGKQDMSTAIFEMVKQIEEQGSNYKAGYQEMGVKEGIVGFSLNPKLTNKVPSEIIDKMVDLEKKIASGEIDVKALAK